MYKKKKCLFYEKETTNPKFCSTKCQAEYRADKYIKDWLAGKETGGGLKDPQMLSAYVRNYLLNRSNYKCSLCGWGETSKYTHRVPLEIDHIDGNSLNNRPYNLRVLCPNCHSLTEFHGILNKGNGRRKYRELYKK